MGCHRSGTNLLYDMLLSAGGFAIYRGFLPVYETLIPRFGSLKERRNRKNLLQTWVRSEGFRRTSMDAEPLCSRMLNDCRSGGDFNASLWIPSPKARTVPAGLYMIQTTFFTSRD
jgi:hypothetical protein